MIKLVATDMDGTLLNSCGQLPTDTIKIFGALADRGIRVVVASGRPYAGLRDRFAEIGDKLVFLCENGGSLYHGGLLLDSKPLPAKLLEECLRTVRMIQNHYPIFCGVKRAYTEDTDPDFLACSKDAYPELEATDNLEEVIGKEPIVKIAVFNTRDRGETDSELLKLTLKDLSVVPSGRGWVDIGRPDATKGDAIRFLQAYFGIEPSECMAFGDYYNDVGMLAAVEESYAVANAVPEAKEAAKHVCQSNDENGVLRILKHL